MQSRWQTVAHCRTASHRVSSRFVGTKSIVDNTCCSAEMWVTDAAKYQLFVPLSRSTVNVKVFLDRLFDLQRNRIHCDTKVADNVQVTEDNIR